MNEDTMTAEPIEEQAQTCDVIAAMTERRSWEDDETYALRIGEQRSRRDRKAEAHMLMARTVVENDLPWPSVDLYLYGRSESEGVSLAARYWVDDLETFRLVARAVRRAVGGLQTKSNDDGSLTATVVSGQVAWDVTLAPSASPCEQVKIGTETKVQREEITPPRYREVEAEVPVYEWRCPPSVLDDDLLAKAEDAAGEEVDPT